MQHDDTRDPRPIIIDQGSGVTKVGHAGTNPKGIFPTIIGRAKQACTMVGASYKDAYLGDEAITKRGSLALTYPMENGIITHWDNMEKIWHHAFYNVVRAAPEEQPVLITEPVLNPKANKEKMTQIMFETFNVPALYISTPAPLCLYAEGTTTGVVVDIGDGVTQVTPICEGFPTPHALTRINMGGRDLTEYLSRMLTERGYYFQTSSEKEIVREIKERLCFVSSDFEEDVWNNYTNQYEKNFTLPDGNVVSIEKERFRCSEALFQPQHIGLEVPGIHLSTFNTINKCDIDSRKELFGSVLLAGGTTLLPGMEERLSKELSSLAPATVEVKVSAPARRLLSAWLGGSILAELSVFQYMWTSKEEYDESGPAYITRRRFCW